MKMSGAPCSTRLSRGIDIQPSGRKLAWKEGAIDFIQMPCRLTASPGLFDRETGWVKPINL